MYGLYAASYADTTRSRFASDLDGKTHVVLLHEPTGELCGFSTIEVYAASLAGRHVRVIFSGDTIIDPGHWGSSALAFEWIRFAGLVKREDENLPLYWFLIAKGHRTYRFLSTFARRYVPSHRDAARSDEQALLDAVATQKFGDAYNAATGVIRFAEPCGRLAPALAEVSERHRGLPAVDFFLRRNPGYRSGDELACLCELTAGNLRPLATRLFVGG